MLGVQSSMCFCNPESTLGGNGVYWNKGKGMTNIRISFPLLSELIRLEAKVFSFERLYPLSLVEVSMNDEWIYCLLYTSTSTLVTTEAKTILGPKKFLDYPKKPLRMKTTSFIRRHLTQTHQKFSSLLILILVSYTIPSIIHFFELGTFPSLVYIIE